MRASFAPPRLLNSVTYVLNLLCYLCPEPAPASHQMQARQASTSEARNCSRHGCRYRSGAFDASRPLVGRLCQTPISL